jgi:hypothetical protein
LHRAPERNLIHDDDDDDEDDDDDDDRLTIRKINQLFTFRM